MPLFLARRQIARSRCITSLSRFSCSLSFPPFHAGCIEEAFTVNMSAAAVMKSARPSMVATSRGLPVRTSFPHFPPSPRALGIDNPTRKGETEVRQ